MCVEFLRIYVGNKLVTNSWLELYDFDATSFILNW
jgi:hypothetical protein